MPSRSYRHRPQRFIQGGFDPLVPGNVSRARCTTNLQCHPTPSYMPNASQSKRCVISDPTSFYGEFGYGTKASCGITDKCIKEGSCVEGEDYFCTTEGLCGDAHSPKDFRETALHKGENTYDCNTDADCDYTLERNRYKDCLTRDGERINCKDAQNVSCRKFSGKENKACVSTTAHFTYGKLRNK